MLCYTRTFRGKRSVVISNATVDEVTLLRTALECFDPTSKFYVYEGDITK